MDGSRIIPMTILCLSYVLLSDQVVPDASSNFVCPLMDTVIEQYSNGTIKTQVARAISCQNGRNMSGCCVARISCDYNTTNIDLTMYGPRGFVMPCSPDLSCCPQKFILQTLKSSSGSKDNSSSDSSDSGDNSGADDNKVDSDASDESDENSDKIPSFTRK